MNKKLTELWICHNSIDLWNEANCWTEYFEQMEQILNVPMSHLDDKDPVRTKVDNLANAGRFVCDFKAQEVGRWLFGKFEGGIRFSIYHQRKLGSLCNSFTWYLPQTFMETTGNRFKARALFDLGNRALKPFYSYSDELKFIITNKKTFGAVNLERELLGIFWLTYFNSSYVSFFGKDKFTGFSEVDFKINGGATVVLGSDPNSVTVELREQCKAILGRESFVNPSDILTKAIGRFVLTFQQLQGQNVSTKRAPCQEKGTATTER